MFSVTHAIVYDARKWNCSICLLGNADCKNNSEGRRVFADHWCDSFFFVCFFFWGGGVLFLFSGQVFVPVFIIFSLLFVCITVVYTTGSRRHSTYNYEYTSRL